MVLGGKTARVEREKFARVLHLFYAGDAELKAEIDSNAISQEWLNVLAREALSAERVAATDLQLVPAGGTSNADLHAASAGALPLLRKTRGNIQQTGLSQTGRSDEGGHSNSVDSSAPPRRRTPRRRRSTGAGAVTVVDTRRRSTSLVPRQGASRRRSCPVDSRRHTLRWCVCVCGCVWVWVLH